MYINFYQILKKNHSGDEKGQNKIIRIYDKLNVLWLKTAMFHLAFIDELVDNQARSVECWFQTKEFRV